MADEVKAPARQRSWRLRVLVLALSLVAGAILAEIVVRVRFPALSTYRDFEPGIYAEDKDCHWVNLANYRGTFHSFFEDQAISTNALGFRGVEPPAEGTFEQRVLCLGDSNTFGRGVAEDETYPAQLAAELARRGTKAAVWNSGVCGYDTEQELSTLRRYGAKLRPTTVTLGWLENDITGPAPPMGRVVDGYMVEREKDIALVKERLHGRFWESSYLARLIDIVVKIRRARHRVADDLEPTKPPSAADIDYNLESIRKIRKLCGELGARLIVIVYVGEAQVQLGKRGDVVTRIETTLRAEGVEVVSGFDLFKADYDARGKDTSSSSATGATRTKTGTRSRLKSLRA